MIEHYGDIVELDYRLGEGVLEGCKQIQDWEWNTEKTRQYIDLIGRIDQGYRGKDEDDLEPNEFMKRFPEAEQLIKEFEGVYKARIARMQPGSYFEPHRDHFQGGIRFRILVPLNNTGRDKYAFFYEDKIIEFKERVPYILNTRKVHGAMCFAPDTYHLLLSVNNTVDNQRKAVEMMTFR